MPQDTSERTVPWVGQFAVMEQHGCDGGMEWRGPDGVDAYTLMKEKQAHGMGGFVSQAGWI